MSNYVDFYQAEAGTLAIPAARAMLFVDGHMCTFLEVVEIVRAGYPEFGWAKLIYNTSACDDSEAIGIENIEQIVAMGRSVSIRQLYDSGIGESRPEGLCIFDGWVEQIDTKIGPGGEIVEIIARDISAKLERITVHGRRVTTGDGATIGLEGIEAIFNEDRAGNAAKDSVKHDGKDYTVFAADERKAKRWSCGEIVHYLLCEYLPYGQLQVPSLSQIEGVMGDTLADELDTEGVSLVKALRRCCEQAGVGFKFVSRQSLQGSAEGIVFYRDGVGRRVELNCQRKGVKLNVSRTNVWQLGSERNFWPVTHRYIGKGELKVYEATYDLIKAWDSALEGGEQSDYSPSMNEDFDSVRDVYRRWCLNEAGDYTGQPYNQEQAFDFSKIFETENYAQRPRRFLKALSTDSNGESLGYYLEVSYDDGATWQEYTDGFDVLSDECGVWLNSDELGSSMWSAISAGTLKFRMTTVVESDERLNVAVNHGPVGSAIEVVEHLVTLPRKFEYRKVSPKSIFHKSTAENIGTADESDDVGALMDCLRREAQKARTVIETIEVRTPFIAMHYEPGDRVVSGPDGRDILGSRRDSRSMFWIERVVMDLEKQSTKIKVLRRRIYR